MSDLALILEYDPDLENPSDNDGWKVHSFGRKHVNFTDPSDLGVSLSLDPKTGLPPVRDIVLNKKLHQGLAFWLSYYEHSICVWFRNGGRIPGGVEFQWDGARVAGILIWEQPASRLGPKTYAARAEDADRFLSIYTDWANGHGYYYSLEEDGMQLHSCGGFYDTDVAYMFEDIRSEMKGRKVSRIEGDASDLAKYHKL